MRTPSWDDLLRGTPVTVAVVAAWVATFLLDILLPGATRALAFEPANPITRITGLVTNPLIHPGGVFGTLIGGFVFYQFGSSLERRWGPRSFLRVLLAVNVATTLLLAFGLWLFGVPYVAIVQPWLMLSAVVVAWAWLFADQQIMLYFLIPLQARWVGWGTVALAFLFTPMTYVGAGPFVLLLGPFALGGIAVATAYVLYRDRWGWIAERRQQNRTTEKPGRAPLRHPASRPLAWLTRPYTEWQRKRRVAQLEKTFRLDE